MAVIDSKKLLPPSKSAGGSLVSQKFLVPVSNIIPKSSAIIKAPQSSLVPYQDQGKKTLLDEIVSIHKKVLRVEEIISINTNLFKKAEENKRKSLEDDKFEKKEKQLEEKKGISFPGIKGPSLPKTGFLDSIKRFLFYTTLGYAFNKFGKYIPKVIELTTKLTPVFKFFEDFTGNLLNGVIEFIDKGYKAYDKVRELTKFVGGENAQKKFDEFSKQFNTFANLAIIAGMATMGGKRRIGGSTGGISASASRSVGELGTRSGFGAGTAMTPGRYRLPGQAKVGSFGLEQARKGLTFEQSVAAQQSAKQLAKQGAKQSLKSLVAAPIIGSLIGFIIDTVIFREKPSRAAAGAVGSAIGQGLGIALAGGTTLGLGAGIGMLVGGFAGDWLGKALYDTIVGYNQKPIQGRAKGGEVTRGGKRVARPAVRRIQQIKTKPPKIRPQKTIPGKDIGGKKEIEKLFPTTTDPKTKNPLGILETTSNSLKQLPMIGGLMGASLDLVMGQKPDRSVFAKIGNGFGVLIQNAINAETSTTLSNVQKEIVGLANGGTIPRTLSSNENIGMKIGERIARTLETMVNVKVNETLQALRKEFGKQGFGLTDTGPGSTSGELATGTIARGQLTIEQLVGLAKGAGFNQSDAVTMAAVAMAESSGNSLSHRTDTDVHGLWQIRFPVHQDKLKKLGITSRDQLYDPVANAAAAKAIYDSQGITAWSAYTNNNYQKYILSAQRASSAPSITVYKPTLTPDIQRGTGSLSYIPDARGTRLAGDLGDFMKAWGGVPGSIWQHSRHGGQGYRRYPSFHNVDRAIDLGANANEQGPILKKIEEFNRMKGVKPVQVLHAGNDPKGGHNDHVHVAYEKGGKVPGLTRAILGEKGPEFVLDTNTTLALEQNFPGFLDSLNKADYKGTLQVLSNYASYHNPSGSTLMLQRVIIEKPIPMPNRSSGFAPLDSSTASSSLTASLTIG